MAADIVPIRLGLTRGDLYTLWEPRWRDAGDEWEIDFPLTYVRTNSKE